MTDYEDEPKRSDCTQCHKRPAHEFFSIVEIGDKTYQMRAVLCAEHEAEASAHMSALKDLGAEA